MATCRLTSSQCLVHILDGKDAHPDRDAGRDLHLHDPLRTTLGHEFVVRRLTANHSTQHDNGVDLARLNEHPGDERQLERPGSRSNMRSSTGRTNRAMRASAQPINDLVVSARTDDTDTKIRGIELRRWNGPRIRRGHVRNPPRSALQSPVDGPSAHASCAGRQCCRGSVSTPVAPARRSRDRNLRDLHTSPGYW